MDVIDDRLDPVIPPLRRLSKDERAAARLLDREGARYLVDCYYQMQDTRIAANNQVRAMTESGEPHSTVVWFAENATLLENQIKGALAKFAEASEPGRWALSQKGCGPVITAGLLSRLDIEKAPTVGHFWRFAGLDPTVKWNKGEKRPWNAALKRICWLLGESFVKVSGHDDAFYAQIYKERKAQEIARNEAGEFADQAAAALASKRWKGDTMAKKHYEAGRLPPARIHLRACRYSVKLFLSHLHQVWYEDHYGKAPPFPYPIAQLGHAHMIAPPRN